MADKKTYSVTLPDGSVETFKSAREIGAVVAICDAGRWYVGTKNRTLALAVKNADSERRAVEAERAQIEATHGRTYELMAYRAVEAVS